MKTYTQDDVKEEIRKQFADSSMSQVARDKGISVSHLSDILTGRQGVSENVAAAFGFTREVTTEVKFRRAG